MVKQRVTPHPPVSINIYRNLALGFSLVVALVFVFVFLVTFARAEIVILPKETIFSADLRFDIGEGPLSSGMLPGAFREAIEQKDTTVTIEEGALVDERAGGTVRIYNNLNRSQTLIATTRLLSSEGVLFRLQNRITIPAQGQIETRVYADQAGKSGEIGPTRFTIPGLNPDLQKYVYAESAAPMTGGQSYRMIITQDTLNRAYESLEKEIVESLKEKLKQETGSAAPHDPYYIYTYEVLEKSADTPIGTETKKFKVSATVHVVLGVVSTDELLQNVRDSLVDLIPQGRAPRSVGAEELSASLEEYNVQNGTGKIQVAVNVPLELLQTAPELAKARFFGLTNGGAENYLRTLQDVEQFEVRMPFYMKRIPASVDRLRITVQ